MKLKRNIFPPCAIVIILTQVHWVSSTRQDAETIDVTCPHRSTYGNPAPNTTSVVVTRLSEDSIQQSGPSTPIRSSPEAHIKGDCLHLQRAAGSKAIRDESPGTQMPSTEVQGTEGPKLSVSDVCGLISIVTTALMGFATLAMMAYTVRLEKILRRESELKLEKLVSSELRNVVGAIFKATEGLTKTVNNLAETESVKRWDTKNSDVAIVAAMSKLTQMKQHLIDTFGSSRDGKPVDQQVEWMGDPSDEGYQSSDDDIKENLACKVRCQRNNRVVVE